MTAETTESAAVSDLPATLAALPGFAAERFGDRPAQRFARDGAWHDLSYRELDSIGREIAHGLVALGVAPGDRVCVLAETRPEWLQAEVGIALAGAVTVPIYPSSSTDECEWVIGNSGAVAVICENAAQIEKVEQVRGSLPNLSHIVTIDADAPGVPTLAELRAEGDEAEIERRIAAVQPDDPGLIIYTSGTTGRPKGCVLSHRALTACVRVTVELDFTTDEDVVYLFLPLAHVYAQVIVLSAAGVGAAVAYCSGGPQAIMGDLQAVSPTVLPSVPRIFEKVYAGVSSLVPAELRERAVSAGLAVRELQKAGQPVPPELQAGFDRAEELLFSKVRAAFGGRIRNAISGAAPIGVDILRFFHAAGVPVNEGYGMSETAAIGTVNTPDHVRIGTVGRSVPGAEVRIADDGEILMRGPQLFSGYWNNPEATAETVIDGWLHSGDLGAIDDDGYLSITGRKKDIIITAGGKNLTPANIENDLRGCRWISQAVMHGDRRPFPVALITLDIDEIGPWATQQGLPADLAELSTHASVHALVQDVLDEVNQRYAQVAQIKKFHILDRDLTVESGELTPTLKVKRRVVDERHAAVFDSLYSR